MAVRKTEIAGKVLAAVEASDPAPLGGGSFEARIQDLAALSLIPWFCDSEAQWAVRISHSGEALSRKMLSKAGDAAISAVDGRLLVGVSGDGFVPGYFSLKQLTPGIAALARPGMTLELASANLQSVRWGYSLPHLPPTDHGRQRYLGTVGEGGLWRIERTTPALTRSELEIALDCARKYTSQGPWEVAHPAEAEAILTEWMTSFQANISPFAVKQLLTLKDLRFDDAGKLGRHLIGLAMGYFRHRLRGSNYRWQEPFATIGQVKEIEAAIRKVVGASVPS